MSPVGCPHGWQVEAARDGRLQEPMLSELRAHLDRCSECARAQAELLELASALRASTPQDDELQLRRMRQRVLSELDRKLCEEPAAPRLRRVQQISAAALAACALALLVQYVPADRWTMLLGRKPTASAPEPVALRLTADSGARFEHERRGDLEYVMLHEGSLHIAFDRSLHARLAVRTPDGELEDFGTVFAVTVQDGYTQRIRVEEGAVRFRRAGQPDLMLTAGEQFDRPVPLTEQEPLADPVLAPAEAPAHPAPVLHARAPAHRKLQPAAAGDDEDRAYLDVLQLLRTGKHEAARAAAQRYCRSFPSGLRVKELLPLARGAAPGLNPE